MVDRASALNRHAIGASPIVDRATAYAGQLGQLGDASGSLDDLIDSHCGIGWNFQPSDVKSFVGGSNTEGPPNAYSGRMEKLATLGERLRWLRQSRGDARGRRLTVQEVATDIGIERSTLSGYENDLDTPGYHTFVALADYYSVSLDWLAKGGEAEPPDEGLRKAARKAGINPKALETALEVIRLASGGKTTEPADPAPREPAPKKVKRKPVKA